MLQFKEHSLSEHQRNGSFTFDMSRPSNARDTLSTHTNATQPNAVRRLFFTFIYELARKFQVFIDRTQLTAKRSK